MPKECDWFRLCSNDSIGTVTHPTLGEVECCEDHLAWLLEGVTPPKMIPPMVARVMKNRERAYMAGEK